MMDMVKADGRHMQGKSAKRPANIGAPNLNRSYMIYMVTLASSNECFFSVAYITGSSSIYINGVSIYINGVVVARPAWPIMLLSFPPAINNGIAIIN